MKNRLSIYLFTRDTKYCSYLKIQFFLILASFQFFFPDTDIISLRFTIILAFKIDYLNNLLEMLMS